MLPRDAGDIDAWQIHGCLKAYGARVASWKYRKDSDNEVSLFFNQRPRFAIAHKSGIHSPLELVHFYDAS
jgi:hypothetical protein